jgi:hypothetical protein
MTPQERMEAEQAIARIVYQYARALDTGDFDGLRHVFRHGKVRIDGVADEHHGGDGVVKMFRDYTKFYDDGTPSTKHVTTNLVIDVESPQKATSWSYFTVLQARPELPLQIVIAGRYLDTWEVVDGEWALTDRLEFCDLVGDLSQHIMGDPLANA